MPLLPCSPLPSLSHFPHYRAIWPLGAAVILGLCFPDRAGAQVRLNEFMAANDSTAVPNAVAGTFDDWVELYNESASSVDLGGWSLTDNGNNPLKWVFPAGTLIPAGGYRIIFASGANAPDANGNPHTSFSLSAAGEYLALYRPDGTLASGFEEGGAFYPPQEDDVSYGRKPGDLSSVYFATATPGGPNAANGYLKTAPVEASVRRGFYSAPFTVTLTTATPGAVIYYTLDSRSPLLANGTPAAGALTYSGPVSISTTTVLRSSAVKTGHDPAPVDAQTYIFPSAVATQTRPSSYPTTWGSGNAADYAVDAGIANGPVDQARFQTGLRNLPTLSVSTAMEDLFGPSGIYTRSTDDTLEAAVSAEYFQAGATGSADGVNAEAGFLINCGLKVQGGSSRNYSSSAKHSFSLRFRSEYGDGKLNYKLFGGGAVDSFNSVQLRAMYNNSWTHSSADQRARATMIHDQWMRDSMLDMGQPDASHGKYVNLYLNGLFWGVYNLHERSDNDHYAAYRDGADKETVFGFNPGSFTPAEQTSLNQMKSAVSSGVWSGIIQRLDVDSYIDYHIMQHFGHNDDLKTDGNWRAAGGGSGNWPWRFYLWDSERVLENPANTSALAVSQDGVGIIDGLDHLPEFQVRFADRAWRHLTNGGALTNERNRIRFQARVAELDDAITGESARWGDWRVPATDYTRAAHWLPAINGPLSVQPTGGVLGAANSWFPATGSTHRTGILLAAWKTQNWPGTTVTRLPNIDPPAFAINGSPRHGGTIPPGGTLSLTQASPSGLTLYVTTDGTDPRQTGGAPQAGLTPYTPGDAVPLPASGPVRARWFNPATSRWSALNEAVFYLEPTATAASSLRIEEIHYHPAEPTPLEQVAGAALNPPRVFAADDFQFLEIRNTGPTAVNLDGCRLTGGVEFTFGNVPLAPGGRTVVVESAGSFALRCPEAPTPAGTWTGSLARGGETLILLAPDGAEITQVSYSDGGEWPSRADGDGSSLEIINPAGDPADPDNWRSSIRYHGTPGTAGPAADGRVLVNEILAHTDPPLLDSIELVNPGTAPVDVSGWFLSDTKTNYRKFRIPDGTILPPAGYVAFDGSRFGTPDPKPVTGYSGTPGAAPVTVTSAGHGLATGDMITISGYGGYGAHNGSFQVTATGPDTFTLPVTFLDDAGARGSWTRGVPFALNSYKGEDVWLMEGKAGGELISFVDRVAFPATLNGISLGRWPDAQAGAGFLPMISRTFGAANSGVRAGPLLISEIMARPGGTPETDFEYVEILNTGETALSLDHWTLRGDVSFDFAGQTLMSGSRLVVVGFSPSDSAKVAAFRSHYSIAPQITLAGPWSAGQSLGDTGGLVRLHRADEPPAEEPALYPQVIEDEAAWAAGDPWPVPAGTVWPQSLHRTGPDTFGGEAAFWRADAPTPGYPLPAAPDGLTVWMAEHGLTGGLEGDADRDGIPNLVEYALRLNPALSDAAALPQPGWHSGGQFGLVFQLRVAPGDPAVIPEMSLDLQTWSEVPDVFTETAGGISTRTVRTPIPAEGSRIYLRLRVTR